ncbi:MAG TPA: hypothetical protein VM261_17145 [Kofleriaceae bacterium]|nr:hypothetical protein [Kofleriaceae bacterium]
MRIARLALASLAAVSTLSAAACTGDDGDSAPPSTVALTKFTQAMNTPYEIDVDGSAVTISTDFTTVASQATLTAEGAAQLDLALDMLVAGWDPPYGCSGGGDCLQGESYKLDGDGTEIWIWNVFNEPRPEVAQLRTFVVALRGQLAGCTGGTLIEQCAAPQ